MSHDLTWMAAEGGVVTKPFITHLKNGTAMLKFGLVCEPKRKKSGEKVKDNMYFTVTCLGKTAETVYPRLRPGIPVRVEGEYADGIYRDAITDEPVIGRVIFASRIKTFIFWNFRKTSDKTKELWDASGYDLDDLPY